MNDQDIRITNDEAMYAVLSQDGFIMLNKQLSFAIGVNENIIFTELLSKYNYYKNNNKLDDEGFFYCTAPDLYASTSLTERQQQSAINNLCKFSFIYKVLKGVPARRYFKILATQDLILAHIKAGESIRIKALKDLEKQNKNKTDKKKASGKTSSNKMSELLNPGTSEDIKPNLSTKSTRSIKKIPLVPTKCRNWYRQNVGTGSNILSELVPTKCRSNNIRLNNIINKTKEEEKEKPSPSIPSIPSAIGSENEVIEKKLDSSDLSYKVLSIIKNTDSLTDVSYNTWLKNLKFYDDKDTIIVEAPSDFSLTVIKQKYLGTIKKALKVITGKSISIKLTIRNQEAI